MTGILGKISWSRSIGLYISGNRATFTEVGSTLAGKVILKEDSISLDKDKPGAAVKELLERNSNHRKCSNIPVCVGLGPEQTFFITCMCNFEQQEKPSLKDLLETSKIGSALNPDDIVTDYFRLGKIKLNGNQLWTLAACRQELAKELFTAIRETGAQNVRLQPGPLTLPLTYKHRHNKKKWKIAIRVLLAEGDGLAVLEIEGRTLLWRGFAFADEPPLTKIISAIRTILAHTSISFKNPLVEVIILQGSKAGEYVKEISENLGMEVITEDAESLTDNRYSYGLALSAAGNNEQAGLDMFRNLREASGIMDMFPWKRVAAVVMAIACLGFVMLDKLNGLNQQYNNLKRQNAEYKWSKGKKTSEISKQQKQLLTEVEAVNEFLSSRIIWSDYLKDLPTRVPENACLSNIWGISEMKEVSKKEETRKVKKSLTIRGVTKFAEGVAAPQEIESFLESLRNVDLLKRDFPLVQLAEIKWRKEGTSEIAMFTVVAMPKKKSGGGGDSKGDSKGGSKGSSKGSSKGGSGSKGEDEG
jgi:Tfp pilus assembly protein PilN